MIPLVVHVEDVEANRKEQFAFMKSPVRIGRGELNDLPLARPFVSTYHGVIQFDEAEARYVDLGSTNGSVLDGTRLERNRPALLGAGAELDIGNFRLTFARRITSERPAVPRAATMFAMRVATSSALGGAGPPRSPVPQPGGAEAPEAGIAPGPGPGSTAAPPAPPPLDPGSAEAARLAVEAASLDLDLHYASYRGAWEHLRSAIEGTVAGLDETARRAALETLAGRYGSLSAEPQFTALAGAGAVPAPAAVAPAAPGAPLGLGEEVGPEAMRLLRAFGESYLPVEPRLASGAEIETMLGRVSVALEAFARSFLELRKGHEEFGREMGVRTVQGEGALHRARDARQLLGYVLDPRAEGRDRELQRAFADFMLHQVALLRGVVDGAKGLLGELSPETISASAPPAVWPMRAAALWKAFEARFHEIADEEDAVSELLFGKEFARAYASMVGQRASQGSRDGEGPDPGRAKR